MSAGNAEQRAFWSRDGGQFKGGSKCGANTAEMDMLRDRALAYAEALQKNAVSIMILFFCSACDNYLHSVAFASLFQ